MRSMCSFESDSHLASRTVGCKCSTRKQREKEEHANGLHHAVVALQANPCAVTFAKKNQTSVQHTRNAKPRDGTGNPTQRASNAHEFRKVLETGREFWPLAKCATDPVSIFEISCTCLIATINAHLPRNQHIQACHWIKQNLYFCHTDCRCKFLRTRAQGDKQIQYVT